MSKKRTIWPAMILAFCMIFSLSPAIEAKAIGCTPEPNADLSGCDFSSRDLASADLHGANLTEANLSHANLQYANLSDADLTRANLSNANLEHSSSRNANFEDANLTGTNLRYAYHNGSNLTRANLSNATFVYGSVDESNLTEANLSSTNFSWSSAANANFEGADLSDASLSQAELSGANLSGANLSGAWLWNAVLNDADLRGANLTRVILNRATLNGADFTGATLNRADLHSVDLTGATLNRAIIWGVKSGETSGNVSLPEGWRLIQGYLFGPGADLEFADLSGFNLSGATLNEANLSRTTLTTANLQGANLSGADLSGANLNNANLSGANLNNANLRGANLSGSNLNGSNFEGSDLTQVSSGQTIGIPSLPWRWTIRSGYLIGPDADLSGANLSNADLRDVDLGFSRLWDANLDNANLSGAYLVDLDSKNLTGIPVLPADWKIVDGKLVGRKQFSYADAYIEGVARVGNLLKANAGSAPKPSAVKYEWFANGLSIGFGKSITLAPDTVGKKIQVQVAFEKSLYNKTLRTSEESAAVLPATFSASWAPTISGNPLSRSVLTAKIKAWSPSAAIVFEWFADGENLNVTGSTLLLGPSQVGKSITVRVTGSALGYVSVTKLSKATSVVKLPLIPKIGIPKVTPLPASKYEFGSTLQISHGTWTEGTTFQYQWLRNGSPIADATNSTYTLVLADISKKISVTLLANLPDHRESRVTTKSTPAVYRKTRVSLETPQVIGAHFIGEILSVSGADWIEADSYKYVWKRNGVAIKNETSSTYLLQAADKGKTITVSVTAILAGHNDLTKSSISLTKVT